MNEAVEAPAFPNYEPPEAKHLMKAIKSAMKLKGKVKRRGMRKILRDPPGCKLHVSPDVKVKSSYRE